MKLQNKSIFLAIALLLLSSFSFASDDSLCAVVKIEIKQELTLERQAFNAHMRINNGLTHLSIENVKIDVHFADKDGQEIIATSDPTNTDALFFIRLDSMTNIDDISGSGLISPSTSADINWLIIPTTGAAKGEVFGTLYYVGATLTYDIGGEQNITKVSPDYIYVKPLPELTLDYFLPHDVYGDDAFTSEIETPIPFPLGLRVKNSGLGSAKSLKIESAQPKIIENKQGLLIGFAIESCKTNGNISNDSLLADFGIIEPNSCGTSSWIMTCSLSGRFIDFTAEFTHSDELGGELTSLIKEVNTHFLIKDVLVDIPGRDKIDDFLTKDGSDYKIYESENIDTVVSDQSAYSTINLKGSYGSEVHYTLSTSLKDGFIFIKLSDPSSGTKIIKSVYRSDGKYIKKTNAWQSKTRNSDNGWDYYINLFDANAKDSYTFIFEDEAAIPAAPVLQFIPDRTCIEGENISFIVEASDPNGTIPLLSVSNLPARATFIDQKNGVGVFDWTPKIGQYGVYNIIYKAFDGVLESSKRAIIKVYSADDTDGDNMKDSWELLNFGTLDRDGSGDFDNDGILDIDEYINGTNPLAPDHAPTPPVIQNPVDNSEVQSLSPELTIFNSSDEDSDNIFYEFEVYSDINMANLIDSAHNITETSWKVSVLLEDNHLYFWRVRAFDGKSNSIWTYGRFFVNTSNDAPSDFYISTPSNNTNVDTLYPILEVTNSKDLDGDILTYSFEIFDNINMTNRVALISNIPEGTTGFTSSTISQSSGLQNNKQYYFRAIVTDEHGLQAYSNVSSFNINTENVAPLCPNIIFPESNREIDTDFVALTVNSSQEVFYYFEVDQVNTFDSPLKIVSSEIPSGVGNTEWDILNLSSNTKYFWRVKAIKDSYESQWVNGEFFINLSNDYPSNPTVNNPGENSWIDTLNPFLKVNSSIDPDNDQISYKFEIFEDENFVNLVVQGESFDLEWKVPVELKNKTRYYWRAQALDEHGQTSEWTNLSSFFVSTNNTEPPSSLTIKVKTSKGSILSGIKVYAFTSTGHYTNVNSITDDDGIALFEISNFTQNSYKFRADYFGNKFWSELINFPVSAPIEIIIAEETTSITVSSNQGIIEGAKVYLFSESDAYLGIYQITDENGMVYFNLPIDKKFKFRADYMGNKYWSEISQVQQGNNSIMINTGGGIFKIKVQENPQSPLPDIKVYLFNENDSYLGVNQINNLDGIVEFDVSEGVYKVRADYLGYKYWSSDVSVNQNTDIELNIPHKDVNVTINSKFQGEYYSLEGVKVYLFTPSGSYMNKNFITDSNGIVTFHIPDNVYKVRADYLGKQYWSVEFTGIDVSVNIPITEAEVTVIANNSPIGGIKVYVFSETGSYLGKTDITDINGKVKFLLPEGNYKFRADYQNNKYWSSIEILSTESLNEIQISAGGGTFALRVLKDTDIPLVGVKCYAFSGSGSYLNFNNVTDNNGQVFFSLSDGIRKFRVDYLGYKYWTDDYEIPTSLSGELIIPHKNINILVNTNFQGAFEALAGIKVYLFTPQDSYMGTYQITNENGQVIFNLPDNIYKVRADYLDNKFWSDEFKFNGTNVLIEQGIADIYVNADSSPVTGAKIYLFSEANSYLGQYKLTDSSGNAQFFLPNRSFKFRIDKGEIQKFSSVVNIISGEQIIVNVDLD
ncbi:MAG: Ig-like domain-containing protein [Desulfobacterales bacterium]|nr:Ig-like domain-containing protein [Desulfobacterales bacterium]